MTDRTATRASYLSPPDFRRLDWACAPIRNAFRTPPYLVGSVLTRPDYRDIDMPNLPRKRADPRLVAGPGPALRGAEGQAVPRLPDEGECLVTDPADIVRAATIGRRAPIGRIRYAAERLSAVLERGADPTVNLLAVRTILEGVADELEGDDPLRTPATQAAGSPAWALRITVSAPTPDDAERWTRGIRDMVTAAFGDSMRLGFDAGPVVANPATDTARPMLRPGSYPKAAGDATAASDMCPRCKGDNSDAWALCAACEDPR